MPKLGVYGAVADSGFAACSGVGSAVLDASAVTGRPGVDQAATEWLCAPADAARKVLEVLGYDPMWIAYDAGQVLTGVIFIHRWNLTRLRVACLDGHAELFRRAE